MRDLLELLIRVKWWFYGDHLRYDKYYDIARIRKLGLDPRANRRAHFKAEIALIIGLYVACEVAMVTLEQYLHFDAKLGPLALNLAVPFFGLAFNTVNWAFTTYANPHLDHIIHEAFRAAWTAFAYGFVGTLLWSNRVYMSSRWDRTELTTELGTARWATPDELTDKRGSLLPEGYDVIFGFTKEARARMKRVGQLLPMAIPLVGEESAGKPEAWRAMLIAVLCSLGAFVGGMPSTLSLCMTVGASALLGYAFRERIGAPRCLYFSLAGTVAGIAIAGIFAHAPGTALHMAMLGAGTGTLTALLAALVTSSDSPSIDLSPKATTPAAIGGVVVYAIGISAHEPIVLTIAAALAIATLLLVQPKRVQPAIIAAAAGAALPYIAKQIPGVAVINDPSRFALLCAAAVAAFIVAQTYIAPKETPA